MMLKEILKTGKAGIGSALTAAFVAAMILTGCTTSNRSIIQDMIRNENLDYGRKTVVGRVLATDGSPVYGAELTISSGLLTEEAKTDLQGYYNFPPVPENQYTLSVDAHGYSLWSAPIDTSLNTEQNITITAQGFTAANSITGQVKDYTSGRPISAVTIKSGSRTATTNSNGLFALSGLTASSSATLLATMDNYYNEAVDVDTISDGTTVNLDIRMRRRTGAAVLSILASQSQMPISGATVTMFTSEGEETLTGTTASNGIVRIADVWIGNWTVIIEATGYSTLHSQTSISQGENDINLQLEPTTGIISGTVLDRDTSAPISNVYVSVKGGETDNYAFTASNGGFEIYDVKPGTYFLEFAHAHYANPVPKRSVTVGVGSTSVDAGSFTLTSIIGSATARVLVMITTGSTTVPLPAGSWTSRAMTAQLQRTHGSVGLPVDLTTGRVQQSSGEVIFDTLPPGSYSLTIWYADTSADVNSVGGTATGVYTASTTFTLGGGSYYETLMTLQ